MRLLFMGTPDFAVPTLQALLGGPHDVVAVYTQPPRPKGRGQLVQKSPIHTLADAHTIPVFTPRSLKKDAEARAQFASHNADLAIVAAYGLLLPKEVLDAPKHGCINVHASLLPRWRGAAPIQYAILKGDTESGVCLMQMEEGLDTGPVLARGSVPITSETTASELHDALSTLGANMLPDLIDAIANGNAPTPQKQDDANSTYAPILKKDDGRVDWSQPAEAIARQVRALNPWPGVWTMRGQSRLKILSAAPVEHSSAAPGTVINRTGLIGCGNNTALRLVTVQPENSKAMDITAAMNGGYLKADDILT